MKIYKLEMRIDKHFKINPSITTLHISREVAENFALREITKGYKEQYSNEYGTFTATYKYCKSYHITEIEVNET